MPMRVIDFDGLWTSDKLAALDASARTDYLWCFGIADANGSFELNFPAIWSRVSPIRPDLTQERVRTVFAEFERVGLLFTWKSNGKAYGHWVGSDRADRPGRLPRPSERGRYKTFAPPVPKHLLAEFESNIQRERVESESRQTHDVVATESRTGLGVGLGVGIGLVEVREAATAVDTRLDQHKPVGPIIEFKPAFSESQTEQVKPNIDPEKSFEHFVKRFRHHVGRSPGTWASHKNRHSDWLALLNREGENEVIAAVDVWAKENSDFLKIHPDWSFGHFLKNARQFLVEAEVQAEADAERGANQSAVSPVSDDDDDDYARMLKTFPELKLNKRRIDTHRVA